MKGFYDKKTNRAEIAKTIISSGVKNTFSFFGYAPIVLNGKVNTSDTAESASRTAFCQIDKNNFILLTTRGKRTFKQTAIELKDLGCKTAVSLDGGSSIGLPFKARGSSTVNIIYYAKRKIADMLYVTELD